MPPHSLSPPPLSPASSSSASHGCTAEFNRLAFIEGALPSVLHATTLQSNGLSSLSMCGRRRFLAGITLAGELGVGEARAEGGQPKPTDEDRFGADFRPPLLQFLDPQLCILRGPGPHGLHPSISFNAFVADVDKQLIQAVDFYGPNGDKAYATYKVRANPSHRVKYKRACHQILGTALLACGWLTTLNYQTSRCQKNKETNEPMIDQSMDQSNK